MADSMAETLARLPGKNCGQCGFTTCAAFAQVATTYREALARCPYLDQGQRPAPPPVALEAEEIRWKDLLDREYDFILEPFPEDPGPRETIAPFNPELLEKLGIKKGDILYGRPAAVGCPVTHVGRVMEEPNRLSNLIVWCVVGPLAAREGGVEIGMYNIVAYEGIVRHAREELRIGQRYYFLPRYCVLQSRHSGLVNALRRRREGMYARLEGIWIS